jgi:transposase-like protein
MAATLTSEQIEYRKKLTAYTHVRLALKEGTLVRPTTCSICGHKGKIIEHHHNYDRPLHVRWVCQSCHQLIHSGKIPDFEVQWYLEQGVK